MKASIFIERNGARDEWVKNGAGAYVDEWCVLGVMVDGSRRHGWWEVVLVVLNVGVGVLVERG